MWSWSQEFSSEHGLQSHSKHTVPTFEVTHPLNPLKEPRPFHDCLENPMPPLLTSSIWMRFRVQDMSVLLGCENEPKSIPPALILREKA